MTPKLSLGGSEPGRPRTGENEGEPRIPMVPLKGSQGTQGDPGGPRTGANQGEPRRTQGKPG